MLTVSGPVGAILTAERTALNLLCHLSGVATLTRRFADEVAGTHARIRDTRKTMPGLRALQKYAVRCGGGVNHRMSLSDAALVKDNHVAAAGSVGAAFAAVRRQAPGVPVEVECRHAGAGGRGARRGRRPHPARQLLRGRHGRRRRADRGPGEARGSGRITIDSARAVAQTGVDYLAVGALTHSAPVLDIGLDLLE